MFSSRHATPGSSWSVLALSLLLYVTQITGQHRVVGVHERIVAPLGGAAVLQCRLEPALDVRDMTVEWSRADLRPHTSDRYVHIYRAGGEIPEMKIRSYAGRTRVSRDRLELGDISLTIRNVTQADQGKYRCFIPTLEDHNMEALVELLVEQQDAVTVAPTTTTTSTTLQTPTVSTEDLVLVLVPILVLVLVLTVLAVVLILKHNRRKRTHLKYDPAPTETPSPSPA